MLIDRVLDMVMKVWMTMSNSTKTGTIAVMTRTLMLMRSEQIKWCMHDGVYTTAFLS